jgi:predicted nucleic acid-binding protein
MKLIADTGLLVAFLNRRDAHHQWAVALMEEAEFPIITCDAVLTEAAWHLRDAERLLQLVHQEVLAPTFDCKSDVVALLELGGRYANLSQDFCDLCVIRLSELFARHTVATVDRRDFSIYRRFGRQVIPIVCPG